MTVRRRDYPSNPQGVAIVKVLDKICVATGHGQDDVFDDWLELCEATLDALPAHARSMAQAGKPADDTPETQALWRRVQKKYRAEGDRKWIFDTFTEAFGLLMASAHNPDGTPDYKDLLGDIYMSWSWPSKSAGQFFTPWNVAKCMADMTIMDGEGEVYRHLTEAYLKSRYGVMHKLMGRSEEQIADFVRQQGPNILTLCAEHYEPITVYDCACGSGILLLAGASCYPSWAIQMGLVQFYGNDIDWTCVRMARVNFMIFGVNGFGLKCYAALTEGELARLPLSEPQREIVAAARETTDPEAVAELAMQLRFQQSAMFEVPQAQAQAPKARRPSKTKAVVSAPQLEFAA